MERKNRRLERQEKGRKIQECNYLKEQKNVLNRVGNDATYLRKRIAEGRVMTARFRLESETRACRYWVQENERRFRCCGKEEETMKHVLEECEVTKEEGNWRRAIEEQAPETARLRRIIKTRENTMR